MSKASTNFLRNANSASSSGRVPDEKNILSALGDQKTADGMSLAKYLDSNPLAVEQVVGKMERSGLVRRTAAGNFALSEAGQRALRYTKATDF